MEIFVYKEGTDHVEEGFSTDDLPALIADKTNVVWVDILAENLEQIEQAKDVLLNVFKFHYLTVEDCIETRTSRRSRRFRPTSSSPFTE